MAKATQVITAQEASLARAFLKRLGGHWEDNALIAAVVAWLHAESGGLSHVLGNNPFNLEATADDEKLRSGVRVTKAGRKFSVYRTLEIGFQAAAQRLLHLGYYQGVVYAARADDPALFLYELALSPWSASHYGLDSKTNLSRLTALYAAFTGIQQAPKGTKPKRPAPLQPTTPDLASPPQRTWWQSGFAIGGFYRVRHARATMAAPTTRG